MAVILTRPRAVGAELVTQRTRTNNQSIPRMGARGCLRHAAHLIESHSRSRQCRGQRHRFTMESGGVVTVERFIHARHHLRRVTGVTSRRKNRVLVPGSAHEPLGDKKRLFHDLRARD